MHSKGIYLGLQGTRILVGFLRVLAVVWQKACMHAIGANNIRAGEGLTWRHQQIECTRLQVWVHARATSSVVVVFTRRACGPQCSIGDYSRALETSSLEVLRVTRSTAKEHTNEIQSGCRDPGVTRPLYGRPFALYL